MKKILSLILVVAMIFTLVACTSNDGNKNPVNGVEDITENTQSATEDQEITEEGGNETTPSTNEDDKVPENNGDVTTENTEETKPSTDSKPTDTESNTKPTKPADTTKPTEDTKPTKPNKPTEDTKPSTHEHSYTSKVTKNATCTEDGTKTFTCSCGSTYSEKISKTGHNWGEWKTTKEPTTSSEGTSQRKCSKCSATESKSIAKLPSNNASVHYVNYEIVSRNLPNAHYIGGVDMLTKMFGANTALQTGDAVTYKINMSDGGSKGFSVYGTSGCTATVNGNQITMKITGEYRSAEMVIKTIDSNGNEKKISIVYSYVVQYDGDITKSNWRMEDLLHDYARIKYGIAYDNQIKFDEGYTSDRANDPSITKNHGSEGTLDDYFVKSDKSDWVEYAMWLIGEYKKIGIKSMYCKVTNSAFGALASKN